MTSKIIFIGGKGGVGKTTISSSLAYKYSQNLRTLIISTDPAHNLSDIFQIKIKNEAVKISENLYGIEIDSKQELESYVESVAEDTRKLVSPSSYKLVDSYYESVKKSGIAQESALFDRLVNIIIEQYDKWDKIIIDTAPTGHTLRLFSMPQVLKDYSKILLKQKDKDEQLGGILGDLKENTLSQKLEKRYLKYSEFNNLLKDSAKCGIYFVLNAEKLAIEETKRAFIAMNKENIKPLGIYINKLLPKDSNDEFINARKAQEAEYLSEIESYFKDYTRYRIYLKQNDIIGITNIAQIAFEM